jgi:glycosyltransferase involved in cell wall biosynthesis
MRIALDARIIASSGTGIARYTLGLLKGWSREFPDDEWLFLSHRDVDLAELGLSPDIRCLVVRFPDATLLRPIWEHAVLPGAVRRLNPPPDVFFSPLGAVLPDETVPSVATVHDVAFLRFSKILPLRYRLYWKHTVERAVRAATRIIAVSHSTADDLCDLVKAEEAKIRVVHEGVDDAILTEPPREFAAETREKYELPEKFLLFVGTLEPRKNIDFLLDAYERIPSPRTRLVMAGDWGWLSWGIRDRIASLESKPVLLGSVSMEELSCIYRMATVLVFPSLYEGFGLPLAEAMAVGLPIVALNTSSVPEVAGDAAMLVEAGDVEGFVKAISRLMTDSGVYGEYSERGRKRAKLFTWEKAATETRAVFDEILGRTD